MLAIPRSAARRRKLASGARAAVCRTAITLCLGMMVVATARALPPPERVRFPSLDRDERGPVQIEALLFRPSLTPPGENAAPAVPTRILIGAADDWTPAAPCEALGVRAGERDWPLQTTVYPNVHHAFDAPRGKVVHRTDVPNGANPGQGVHIGPEPSAREDANRRVAAFLREILAR